MGFVRYLLLSLTLCLASPQKSLAIATIKSYSGLGLCTNGAASATIEEGSPNRSIVIDIQGLVIHVHNTPAQEYLCRADQWDYG